MSYKKTESKTLEDFEYNLSDPEKKQQIKEFEKELGDRNFDQYCLDKGYLVKVREGYNLAVNKDCLLEYIDARQKNKALESLREARYKVEKDEHISNLSLTGEKTCEEYSLRKDRCVYCYPWTFKEYLKANGREDPLGRTEEIIKGF